MAKFSIARLPALSLCALIFLIGCGGGGGGGGDNASTIGVPSIATVVGTPADLSNESMSNRVASDTPESVKAGVSLNEQADAFSGLRAAAPVASSGSKYMSFAQLGQKLAQLSFSHSSKRGTALAAATQSETSDCEGGGSTTTTATLHSDVYLNAGDEIFVTFKGCKTSVSNGETETFDGDFRLTATAGTNVNPFTLAGATLAIEFLPMKVTTYSGGRESTVGLQGGFEMQVQGSDQFRIKMLDSQRKLSMQEGRNGSTYTTTLSAFDFSVNTANSYSSTVSGYATVDTTRVSVLSGGATQYQWRTELGQTVTVDTINQRITNGRVLLSSAANSSQTRISFQNCVSPPDPGQCVTVERSSDGTDFTTQGRYTWDAYTALR